MGCAHGEGPAPAAISGGMFCSHTIKKRYFSGVLYTQLGRPLPGARHAARAAMARLRSNLPPIPPPRKDPGHRAVLG